MTQADAPSESWLALPAVMDVPGPSTACSRGQALERRVGAIALVLGDRHFAAGDFTRFLVLDGHRRVTGTISASKRPAACAAAVRCCD